MPVETEGSCFVKRVESFRRSASAQGSRKEPGCGELTSVRCQKENYWEHELLKGSARHKCLPDNLGADHARSFRGRGAKRKISDPFFCICYVTQKERGGGKIELCSSLGINGGILYLSPSQGRNLPGAENGEN